MIKLTFVEIHKNKFGRRWGIRQGRKLIHMGFNFAVGRELFKKLLKGEKWLKLNAIFVILG